MSAGCHLPRATFMAGVGSDRSRRVASLLRASSSSQCGRVRELGVIGAEDPLITPAAGVPGWR